MNVEPRGVNIPFLFDRTPLVIYTSQENGNSWFQGRYDDSSALLSLGKSYTSFAWKYGLGTASAWFANHHKNTSSEAKEGQSLNPSGFRQLQLDVCALPYCFASHVSFFF